MSSPATTPEPEKITAELSDEAGGQIVHLPESFRIPGKVASIRRLEQGILLEPMQSRKKMTPEEIRAMWADMDSYGADPLFPDGRMQGVAGRFQPPSATTHPQDTAEDERKLPWKRWETKNVSHFPTARLLRSI